MGFRDEIRATQEVAVLYYMAKRGNHKLEPRTGIYFQS